jgi:hypothetical protein
MTPQLRDETLARLEENAKEFRELLAPFTTEQWTLLPANGAWSINHCAEHIYLTERRIREGIATAPELPPDTSLDPDERDARVLDLVPQREIKRNAPEPLVPTGERFPTPAAFLAEWETERAAVIAQFLDPGPRIHLRSMPHPRFGELNGRQWMVFLCEHNRRHQAQIREVMQLPEFPR